ncbi:MAG: PAS domain S-box protein [Rhodothermaceae bacterium]|nr:PAS domain S-box protein [Rhodothermaceae bacterium]
MPTPIASASPPPAGPSRAGPSQVPEGVAPVHALLPILGEIDALLEEGVAPHERLMQALAFVRDHVRDYLDQVGLIVVALDAAGRVLFVNRRGCELLGCDEDGEILGADWIETFVPERRRAATRGVFEALWAGDLARAASNENEVVTRSGQERLVAWTNEVLHDETGAVWAVVGAGEDVTERRHAEHHLARIGQAVEAARDGIGIIGPEGRIVYMNPALCTMTGYTPDALEAAGGPPSLFVDPGTGRLAFLHTMREGAWRGEADMRSQNGRIRTVLLRTDLLRDEQGQVLGLVAIHTDITAQRRLEAEVLYATDAERQRIGRDLHDGLASHLVGLGMVVRGLSRRARTEAPALVEELEDIAGFIRDGAEQARAIAHGLNPVSLDRKGLAAALERLATTTDAHADLQCTFAAPGELPALSAEAATQLYRIAQEAVTNALRHAGARRIRLTLEAERGLEEGQAARALVLTVRDDGQGLAAPLRPQEGGLGLRTMAYRAHAIGASLALEAKEGEGVVVRCRLPL